MNNHNTIEAEIPFGWVRVEHGCVLNGDSVWNGDIFAFQDIDIDDIDFLVAWFHYVIRRKPNTFARRQLALKYIPDGYSIITYSDVSEDRVTRDCLVWDEQNGEFLPATPAEVAALVNEFVAVVRPNITNANFDPIIGYFVDADFLCPTCMQERKTVSRVQMDVYPVQVFESNIRPYSQDCHNCGVMCYEGKATSILFDPRPKIKLTEHDLESALQVPSFSCKVCRALVRGGYAWELISAHHKGNVGATETIRMDNRALRIIADITGDSGSHE